MDATVAALDNASGDRMSRIERQLRAFVITLLLTLGFIAGWPKISPHWLAKLPTTLANALSDLPAIQEPLLAPFAPIANAFGIYSENWALFATTGGTRNRMRIEARRSAATDFELLYRVFDDEHRYLASTLEYRRVRNIWNPHRSGLAHGYEPFARWLLARVLREHAEFEAARIRMDEGDILPQGHGFRENGRTSFEIVVRRAEIAP